MTITPTLKYKSSTGGSSLVDQLELQLMQYIKGLNLKVGDALPNEMSMVEQLGVSRSVLREALSRLKMVGLVSSRPRRGMVITEPPVFEGLKRVIIPQFMSEDTIFDMLGLRIALETGMCTDILRNITPGDIEELRDIVKLGVVLGKNTYAHQSETEFHMKLYSITGNPLVVMFQDIISPVVEYVNKHLGDKIQQINDELESAGKMATHSDILHFLETKDGPGFRDAMERHFHVYRRLIEERERRAKT